MKVVFDTDKFEHTFRDFDEFINNDEVDFEAWIPLEHLACERLPIQFTSSIRLMDSLIVTESAGSGRRPEEIQ